VPEPELRDSDVLVRVRAAGINPQDRIGTFAELIAIDQDDLALKPTSLSMQEAAAVPLVGLTAWQALVERAKRPARRCSSTPAPAAWERWRSSSASTVAADETVCRPVRRAPPFRMSVGC
jgi:NADPH:quinone reductase-like Zn-dependent oxidoreductase